MTSGAVSVLAPGTSCGVRIDPSRSRRRRNCGTDCDTERVGSLMPCIVMP